MGKIRWTEESELWLRDIHLKKDKRVEILGVFHGSLDIDRYLP